MGFVAKTVTRGLVILGLTVCFGASMASGIDPNQDHRITAWGIWPADAREEVLWKEGGIELFIKSAQNIGVSKCVIRYEYFTESGEVDETRMGRYLNEYLRKLDLKKMRYVLSSDSPPPCFKKYFSAAGHVDLQMNPLRAEFEDAYLKSVVRVFLMIREAKLPLPSVYLIVDSGTQFAVSPGCPMEREQWDRLAGKLRKLLRAHSLDSILVPGMSDMGDGQMETANTLYVDMPSNVTLDSYVENEPLDRIMTGWRAFRSRSEREACLVIVDRLRQDFLVNGVKTWIYGPIYSSTQSSGGIVYGNGRLSKQGELLSRLWRWVPAGSKVSDEVSFVGSASAVRALRFESKERLTIAIWNPSDLMQEINLPENSSSEWEVWTCGGEPRPNNVVRLNAGAVALISRQE